jgi:hypothetical protein
MAARQFWSGVAPIKNGQATCVFSGVPAGTYAIAVFHAEHDETQMETGLLVNPKNPASESETSDVQVAARALGLKVVAQSARNNDDIDAAFASFVQQRTRWGSYLSPVGEFSDDSWQDRDWEVRTHRHYGAPEYWETRAGI